MPTSATVVTRLCRGVEWGGRGTAATTCAGAGRACGADGVNKTTLRGLLKLAPESRSTLASEAGSGTSTPPSVFWARHRSHRYRLRWSRFRSCENIHNKRRTNSFWDTASESLLCSQGQMESGGRETYQDRIVGAATSGRLAVSFDLALWVGRWTREEVTS
ncbi:hypothetical protein OH77DRAFT_1079948 [Trametes cingulata]|nr:hypothetical protein OH77DRAFT_1079948 [Trametes cingulata]